MNLICELTYIVSKKPPKDLDLLIPQQSKLRYFFDSVSEEKIHTDDEAALWMYNSEKNDKRYLMLKRNLVNKLINLVLETEHSEIDKNNYVNIQFTNERLLTIAEKLLLQNVYHNAEKIIKKVMKQAEKYELISLQLESFKKLRNIYYLKGFPIETFVYQQKIQELSVLYQRLEYVKGAWQLMESKRKFALSKSEGLVDDIYEMFDPREIYIGENDSIFTRLYYHRIQKIKYYNAYEIPKYWKEVQILEQLVEHFPFIRTQALMIDIYLSKARYFKTVGLFLEAESNIKKALSFSDFKAFNRFEVLARYFDLALYFRKFSKAAKILDEVFASRQFNMLDERDISAWLIRETYFAFALKFFKSGKEIQEISKHPSVSNTTLDFIESTKHLVKDKKGYNLLVQLMRMFLIARKNKGVIYDEANNLKTYYYRYLKNMPEVRTRLFVKSLYKLALKDLDDEQIRDKKHYFKMNTKKMNVVSYVDDCELIKYDDVFDMLLRLYKKNELH